MNKIDITINVSKDLPNLLVHEQMKVRSLQLICSTELFPGELGEQMRFQKTLEKIEKIIEEYPAQETVKVSFDASIKLNA